MTGTKPRFRSLAFVSSVTLGVQIQKPRGLSSSEARAGGSSVNETLGFLLAGCSMNSQMLFILLQFRSRPSDLDRSETEINLNPGDQLAIRRSIGRFRLILQARFLGMQYICATEDFWKRWCIRVDAWIEHWRRDTAPSPAALSTLEISDLCRILSCLKFSATRVQSIFTVLLTWMASFGVFRGLQTNGFPVEKGDKSRSF